MKKKLFILAAALVLFWQVGLSEVPPTVNYQGRLLATDGTPMYGVLTLTFKLFGSETGGSLLWSEMQDVALDNGFFNVRLGIVTAFPAGLFNNPLYIETQIAGETMSPRQPLTSAPYALVAAKALEVPAGAVLAPSIVTAGAIAPGAVTTAAIANGAVTNVLKIVCPFGDIGKLENIVLADYNLVLDSDAYVLAMAQGMTSGASIDYGTARYALNIDSGVNYQTINTIFGNTSSTQYENMNLMCGGNFSAGTRNIRFEVTVDDIDTGEKVHISEVILYIIILYK
jgi:hypothetical protein